MCIVIVGTFTVLEATSIAKKETHWRRRTSPLWSDGPSAVSTDTRLTFA